MNETPTKPEKQAGFEIDGVFYPFVSRYTFGDAEAIFEITGMTLKQFGARCAELAELEDFSDPRILVAQIYCAMRRKDKTVTIAHVRELDLNILQDDEDEEPEAVTELPPTSGAGESESGNSEPSSSSAPATEPESSPASNQASPPSSSGSQA